MRFVLALLFVLPVAAQVKIQQHPDHISIDINGKPFTSLWTGADLRKPSLYPIYSAGGKIVTRRWPMEDGIEGEPHDHPHHRGLWFTHGDVNGIDFWGSDPSARNDPKARIAVKKIEKVRSGKDKGSIDAEFEWLDKDGKLILTEDRTMVFYNEPSRRTIDFDIELVAAAPVKFGDTKEGSFGLRLAPSLQETKTGTMVNAEGAMKEKNVWGKRSPWVDYYGMLDGEKVGIAILDHPSNPRHPTYWHSRAYGLFAANMFGLHDFLNDKTQDGSLKLDKGGKLRLRYRVIIHSGDAAEAKIADAFAKYSAVH